MHARQDPFDVNTVGLSRLRVGLVVDREVVEDVLGVLAIHSAEAVLDDVSDLVPKRRVIGNHCWVRGGEQQRVAVLVLESLAVECRSTRRRAEQEPADHLVHRGPQRVRGALEAEHRVKDVDRDHRFAMG